MNLFFLVPGLVLPEKAQIITVNFNPDTIRHMHRNYKKKTVLTCLILIASLSSGLVHAQIKFEHDTWKEIKAKAKSENKLIFLDAFTSWCGPCKWMAKNIFTNDTVAAYYNDSFVNAKIDMEVGEGKEIAALYGVRVYPSLLFIDGDGELVHRSAGSRDASAFIQLGKEAQKPEKQFGTLTKKYKNGEKDAPFIQLYLAALQGAGLPTDEAVVTYFNGQKEEDLTSRENWNMINRYVTDCKSKEFIYLLKNSGAFSKKYGSDSVNEKIYGVYANECYRLIYSVKADSVQYLPLKQEIKKSGFVRADELLLDVDIAYYDKKQDYMDYAKTACAYIEKYKSTDVNILNNCAYGFYQHVSDKTMLGKAEQWARKAAELDPNPQTSMDTYACVLSVNNKKQEAIKVEKQAIEKMKAEPAKYDQKAIPDMEKKISEWSSK